MILSVDELFDGRSGPAAVDGGRRYVRRFRVLCDSAYDGPNTVKAALGIRYGDRYQPLPNSTESDKYSYVNSVDADQEDGDGLGWIVTVTYDGYDPITAGGGPDNNPLLMPIDVTWGYRAHEIVAEYDNAGNLVANTVGDPFDPPLTIDDPRPLLTIVRNEATYDIAKVNAYRNAVNSDAFGPWGPQMAKMLQIGGKSTFHYQVGWYWIVTYEIEFNPPTGYRPLILNQGMRKKSQAAATLNQIVPITVNGQPITRPMLLTKAGYLAKPTDKPYYVQPQILPELPFAIFQFDPVAIAGLRRGFNTQYGPNGGTGSLGGGST